MSMDVMRYKIVTACVSHCHFTVVTVFPDLCCVFKTPTAVTDSYTVIADVICHWLSILWWQ